MGRPTETLDQWAAREARDVIDWRAVEVTAGAESWADVVHAADRHYTPERARALLAFRSRLVAELTKSQRRALKWYGLGGGRGGRGGSVLFRSMQKKGLARPEPGWTLSVELTPLGREIARVLEGRDA